MGRIQQCFCILAVVAAGTLAGCSAAPKMEPNVSDGVRASLDQAGFKQVRISQDRFKVVMSLGGHVATVAPKRDPEG